MNYSEMLERYAKEKDLVTELVSQLKAEVATSSLKNNQPSRALTALRTLLQTYNDDSPYASLHNFIDAFELGEDPTIDHDNEEHYDEDEE